MMLTRRQIRIAPFGAPPPRMFSRGECCLTSAQIMRGRTACAYVGMVDDMVNSGANVVEAEVVVDNNMITCSYYGSVGKFMRAVFDVDAKLSRGTVARSEPATLTA